MNKFSSNIPRVITIAGSDSGGGAGIQADLKTFGANGVYGTSAITAITAQNTVGVQAILGVPLNVIEAQIDSVFTDIGTDAVKIGMLGNVDTINLVADKIVEYSLDNVVLDPVMIAKGGDRLIEPDAIQAMIERLLVLATIVTPNLPEAAVLLNRSIDSLDDARQAAIDIMSMGPKNVVVKGGHLTGSAVDVLYDGDSLIEFENVRLETKNTHGTGCTFSSAIAANLAKGMSIRSAVEKAKDYVFEAIMGSHSIGHGHGPLKHMYKLDI
ncbi:MAG: bifunctional hydroxymethylpyrimidine kinase/phosphomethylpyrimidine kinase [Dehalococcoidia bacterium]|nr:bifunctional hydroxymethylpyrimidine kinase/phosphomethylpyrimidine kinase [Dehalococcoidia bacterium]